MSSFTPLDGPILNMLSFVRCLAQPYDEKLEKIKRSGEPLGSCSKPRCGVWFSVDPDVSLDQSWAAWARVEMDIQYPYMYGMKVRGDAKIFVLACPDDVWNFTKRYSDGNGDFHIDWDKVRDDGYSGVISYVTVTYNEMIWSSNPLDLCSESDEIVKIFSTPLSDKLHWLYTWDCWSGVVWDDCIERIDDDETAKKRAQSVNRKFEMGFGQD